MQANNQSKQSFSVPDFSPAWGAVIMGTGVISSMFSMLSKHQVYPQLATALAQVFFWCTVLFAVPILGITTWKWIRYSSDVGRDLQNPVKGAMTATFAGSFLVLGVIFGRAGATLFGQPTSTALVYLFAGVGGVLTVFVGLMFLTDLFSRGSTAPPMITGAWFIPPVVTIVIPTALAPVLTGTSPLHLELYWLSWGMLGVGSLLYVIIAATVFYRSVTHNLPPQALAPTLVIGMGPPGLIALDLLLLGHVGQVLGVSTADMSSTINVLAMMLWAFGLGWGVAALVVILRAHGKLAFKLSWWGFTFPLGAWVVSGVALGYEINAWIVKLPSLLGAAILLVIWVFVVIKTGVGIADRTIWE